jgi:hypothetical protein
MRQARPTSIVEEPARRLLLLLLRREQRKIRGGGRGTGAEGGGGMMVPPPQGGRMMTTTTTRTKTTTTCPATGGGQRGERATSTMALMMNASTGVSGVRVWRIPGMGDGEDCGMTVTTRMTSRRADRIPPPRRRRRRVSWQRGCVPLAATGSGQRRERVTSTTAATTNTSAGVSGVCIGRIPGMGDGKESGATVTTMTTSKRADRIPPH